MKILTIIEKNVVLGGAKPSAENINHAENEAHSKSNNKSSYDSVSEFSWIKAAMCFLGVVVVIRNILPCINRDFHYEWGENNRV